MDTPMAGTKAEHSVARKAAQKAAMKDTDLADPMDTPMAGPKAQRSADLMDTPMAGS